MSYYLFQVAHLRGLNWINSIQPVPIMLDLCSSTFNQSVAFQLPHPFYHLCFLQLPIAGLTRTSSCNKMTTLIQSMSYMRLGCHLDTFIFYICQVKLRGHMLPFFSLPFLVILRIYPSFPSMRAKPCLYDENLYL